MCAKRMKMEKGRSWNLLFMPAVCALACPTGKVPLSQSPPDLHGFVERQRQQTTSRESCYIKCRLASEDIRPKDWPRLDRQTITLKVVYSIHPHSSGV